MEPQREESVPSWQSCVRKDQRGEPRVVPKGEVGTEKSASFPVATRRPLTHGPLWGPHPPSLPRVRQPRNINSEFRVWA